VGLLSWLAAGRASVGGLSDPRGRACRPGPTCCGHLRRTGVGRPARGAPVREGV